MRACKLCTTSFYMALTASAVFFFLAGIAGAAAGLLAAGLGIQGRLSLASQGASDALDREDSSALERVAARMEKRAKGEAVAGICIGLALAAWWVLVFVQGPLR